MNLKVTITFIESGGTLENYSSNNQANTSRLNKLNIPSRGEKIFYLSEDPNLVTSPVDGTYKWFDENIGYSGWVSNTYSNSSGEFNEGTNPIIKISGSDIKYLILYSDIVEGTYIEQVEVAGLIYTGVDEKLIIAFDEPVNEVNIKILKLNKPYQPVKLTNIQSGLSLEFDKENIIDYAFGVQSQNNPDGVEYSVISRFGTLELDNSNNLFTNLNEMDLLQKDIPIKVKINEKPFGNYLLDDGDLQVNSSSILFQLTDKLINLDQLNWRKDYYLTENGTVKDFLDFIINYIGEDYIFYDNKTEEIFTNTILPVAIIDTSNVKTVLVKICEITCSSIFMNNEGKICVKYLEKNNMEV